MFLFTKNQCTIYVFYEVYTSYKLNILKKE